MTDTIEIEVAAYGFPVTDEVIEAVHDHLDADWRLVDPVLSGHTVEPYSLELSTEVKADTERLASTRARSAMRKALRAAGVAHDFVSPKKGEAVIV